MSIKRNAYVGLDWVEFHYSFNLPLVCQGWISFRSFGSIFQITSLTLG